MKVTNELTQDLRTKQLGRNFRQANAAKVPNEYVPQTSQETADAYSGVVAHLCARHRVIHCKDDIQWVFQRRKKGGAERPWRGVGYFRARNALIRVCASLCGRIDSCALAILASLPDHIGGS